MSSEQEIKTTEVKLSYIGPIIDKIFFGKEDNLIYVITYDSIEVYSLEMKHIRTDKTPEIKRITMAIQNIDGALLIVSNDELFHYSNKTLFTSLIKGLNVEDISISPNGEWILIYTFKHIKVSGKKNVKTQTIISFMCRFNNYVKHNEYISTQNEKYKELRDIKNLKICNDGTILVTKNDVLTKIDTDWNFNNKKSSSSEKYSDACYLNHECTHIIMQNTEFKYKIINLETLKSNDLDSINKNDKSIYYKIDRNGIIYILDNENNLNMYDVQTDLLVGQININQALKINDRPLKIIKITNYIIVYNFDTGIFIYDINKNACVRNYQFNGFKTDKNKSYFKYMHLTVVMRTNEFSNMIIHDTSNVAVINLNAIQEKSTFLLSSLVQHDKCDANSFINSRQFDRHLLPLIFEFLTDF
jgi:hypothetical protein